jgi:hypothetical protein
VHDPYEDGDARYDVVSREKPGRSGIFAPATPPRAVWTKFIAMPPAKISADGGQRAPKGAGDTRSVTRFIS